MRKAVLVLVLTFIVKTISAQFFQGWGIFVGATAGKQMVKTLNPEVKDKSKYLLRYNAEVFAEFIDNPFYRWVTEVQYNVKGAKWKYPSGTTKAVNQYFAWNNYLMLRDETVSWIPYVKIGPRAEYVFSSTGNPSFTKFHVSPALGIGVEQVPFGRIGLVTELFWVPDYAMKSYSDEFGFIRQHCWELRVGIKFGRGGAESCPKVYR